ncbi:MAG: TIGR02680 family protein [Ktedonobacteraceae bacterium]
MQQTFKDVAAWPNEPQGSNGTTGTAEAALARQIDLLQTFSGDPQGYRLRRILLTNFWLYGQQEFEIPHGRLFLAGENASGKSTVLTAALPLALDGDLRPNRLDTFGGRERHIEYYVLGGAESATPYQHERRTAYIALEFEWCDPTNPPIAEELRQRWENGDRERTRFLTIGLSIAGNANASDRIRPLRFLITDGSRLGYDIHTLHDTGNKHEKRAYDHSRFKQVLEGHGIVCDSQAEYERQVSRYLFGFRDEKDFQKLINLLLVLRRPNLSSELSFSRVHDYLKQSLRKISGETTHRVIGTIERIDAISTEIERIQGAYNSTERLHQARQSLALVRAQLAACEYIETQLAEDSVQSRVNRLRKDLSTAEQERQRTEALSQGLQSEQSQVNGQIKALESSEGLQIATQLDTVRTRAQEAEAQLHLQEQNLATAQQAIGENSTNLERQNLRFEKLKTESIAHLRELLAVASEESYWEVAALQLEDAIQQVTRLSAAATAPQAVPLGVTSFLEEQAQERIVWLRGLEELHQQREHLERTVQNARSLETTRFQELDDSRRHFQATQDRAYTAQQHISAVLDQFVKDSNLESHDADDDALTSTDYAIAQASGTMVDDASFTERVLEQFAAALNHYREYIDTLESELMEVADSVQGELDELQLLTGSKNHEIAELKALYEEKQAEPEFTPLRSAHRTLARAKLAEHGIAAHPLYALLDFAPGLDSASAEAGQIEYMLEDAGLLDALVVTPAQQAAAEALLAKEGLSDCLVTIGNESAGTGFSSFQNNVAEKLRFDTTVDSGNDWESSIVAFFAAIGQSAHSSAEPSEQADVVGNGRWEHGLLRGYAGGGEARAIGKATRLRVRQRELDALAEQQRRLAEELQALTQQLAHYEQQSTQLQEQQRQLRKILAQSGLEEIHAALSHARGTLDDARAKYQKAHQQTLDARQQVNAVLGRLEHACNGITPLATDAQRVKNALQGVMKLKNQSRLLQNQLTGIANTGEEYQKAHEALERARLTESNAAQLYERVRHQTLQVQAELAELQHIAASANAEELSERLRSLRERSETLLTELDEAKTSFIRADERVNNATSHLMEAQERLQQAQELRSEKQTRFVGLLDAYPVEQLVELQGIANSGDTVRAARQAIKHLLAPGQAVRETELAPWKEKLEGEYRESYNALSRTFNREQPILLEYGPDLDDTGHVLFLNENKSRPIDLLEILGERIEMQKLLLGQEERQLFEDFLLQEIAEAIRTHILEAEEWVQQINSVLSGLPMIGEHYALQWKPPAEYDLTKLGSHLAQYYRLLRKPAQSLTTEEAETLMNAFRQEIRAVRIRQQETPDMNFMEALEQVFDYREWFHFDVWVTPIGGQRQRLTDRVAGTRSGAEQLFALYVPLFAALGALYRSAAPGAPRLLALDEAFDKVSIPNTQRIMEFLVSQDFQWIMTGPQVSGTGAKIAACARYLMLHEKGSPVATASASFWSDRRS